MPKDLNKLVKEMKQPRDGSLSPNSLAAAARSDTVTTRNEATQVNALANLLFYEEEHSVLGEKHICRDHDRFWRTDCVPKPNTDDDAAWAGAIRKMGVVKDPKPDIAFGYNIATFSEEETILLTSLPESASVLKNTQEPPLFPYFIVEWKSSTGTILAAKCQARRDAAAAINCLRNFYQACGVQEPKAEDTAVFSACVDGTCVQLSIHWRRVSAEGRVSFEADKLESGILAKPRDIYDVRSIVFNILRWAQTSRLQSIKTALAAYKPVVVPRYALLASVDSISDAWLT